MEPIEQPPGIGGSSQIGQWAEGTGLRGARPQMTRKRVENREEGMERGPDHGEGPQLDAGG
jgi:hypothetical protein